MWILRNAGVNSCPIWILIHVLLVCHTVAGQNTISDPTYLHRWWGVYLRINLLKSNSYFMYHQLQRSEILCSAHSAFMCFAWISEQTAIISLYSINLSVFITEAESVFCAVRPGSLNQTDTGSCLKG